MDPVLKTGDILEIIPYNELPRKGDIVVFHSPPDNTKIVHRIISITGDKIFTKGDNNRNRDTSVISQQNILGRVIYARRGKRRISIGYGVSGRSWAFFASKNSLLKYRLLNPVYSWLSDRGYFNKLFPLIKNTSIFSFNKKNGKELGLFLGKKQIGYLPASGRKWLIKPPFRLFIDEKLLPLKADA